MRSTIINDIPSQQYLDEKYPVASNPQLDDYRQQTQDILAGRDKRLLMIVGPCSAWSPDAVYEYADKLARLQEDLREQLFIIMRMVVTKPRTRNGWKGTMMQPDPMAPPDIRKGVITTREMYSRVGQQLPMGDEMVYTENAAGFDNPLTHIWIGARTSLSQQHREVGSGLESPLGVKNPTSGSLEKAVDGVAAAQSPHDMFIGMAHRKTEGNPYAHLILRGTENEPHANYGPASIAKADRLLRDPKNGIENPAVLIDASHDNCCNGHGKDPMLQPLVVESVMLGIKAQREEYEIVRGFLVESFLKGGNQKISDHMEHGVSITDPCLPFEDTEACLRKTADTLDSIR